MWKARLFKKILPACGLFLVLSFFTTPTYATESNSKKKTIFKTWKYLGSNAIETVQIESKEAVTKIVGPGLPVSGVEMRYQVVKVVPNPEARSGKIVFRSELEGKQKYEVLHWYDLYRDTVRICMRKRGYDSPEEAQEKDRGSRELAKTYRAIRWGVD